MSGSDARALARTLLDLCRSRKLTIATAESCTGVKATTLESFGAVSKETATAMAIGALEKAGVDLAVSITGIAGPGGATPGKPVGLVHLAVAARDGRILHRECRFGAVGRSTVRQRSVVEALRMLSELARTSCPGQGARSRQPVAPTRSALAAAKCRQTAAGAANLSDLGFPVNLVGAFLECRGETLKRRIEHRAHQ
jgi:nicotinamide-nucleotide amidase